VRPVALALSPHLDDAAFSCGGTLAALAAAGWRVVVATLFTASVPDPKGFALACQLDKGLGPEVDYMALRRDEDAASCRALGAEPVWLPFREAPHRGYGSAPELFGALRPEDAIGPDLTSAIEALVAEHRPALLLAAQAIGGHVDHVQVVHALDAAATVLPVLWWRDFPYAVKAADREPCRGRFAALLEMAVSPDATARAAGRAAALAYTSQLGFQFGGSAGWNRLAAALDGRERFRLQGALPPQLASIAACEHEVVDA
jgi:LmbE family N-acetylglucosaminyl deacetylase